MTFCVNHISIEKYTRGVSAVESILTLDRLRQSVAVKELLQAQGQPLMRKTASVPNFSQVLLPLQGLGCTIYFFFNFIICLSLYKFYRINFIAFLTKLLFPSIIKTSINFY